MESDESRWLKRNYRPAPSEGPSAKRVKYSEIYTGLVSSFPSKTFNHSSVSATIHSTFPNTTSKVLGHSRTKHILGLEDNLEDDTVPNLKAEIERLHQQVQQLQHRVVQLEGEILHLKNMHAQSPTSAAISLEMNSIVSPRHSAYHGPDTLAHFNGFSLDGIMNEFRLHAPELWKLFTSIAWGESPSIGDEDDTTKVVVSLCTLLKTRSKRVLGLQLLISFMLIARATSRRAITVLNQAGVCVSYSTAWKYLLQLTTEAKYDRVIQEGKWLWVFDNVNFQQRVRHERQERHSSMMNLTSRLAVRIKYLPDWEFDWADKKPQRSRESLTISDFLPSEQEFGELKKRAIRYIAGFLVHEYKNLKRLRQFVPERTPIHTPSKSEFVPMEVLFKDEKYIAQTVEILSTLMKDADLHGGNQVVVGDQLTLKNIRSSKLWRQTEVESMDNFQWVNEVPGDFHFLWECLRVVFTIFWGAPNQPGSLCNLREIARRTSVDKGVKVFNTGDEFLLHAFRAHLKAAVASLLNINTNGEVDHQPTEKWLYEKAEEVVTKCLMPPTTPIDDTVNSLHRSFLHVAFMYLDLREAIRWEDGPSIIFHWKWWIPRFLATGCKNYSTEAVHLIANLQASFPKHMAYIAVHNRTVNTSGKPGHGKPVDQLIEHYNLVFKETIRSGGAKLTPKHIKDVSMCVLFLMEAAQKTDKTFGLSPQSTSHTVHSPHGDIDIMMKHVSEAKVTTVVEGRSTPPFIDPIELGWKKLSTTSWLTDTLQRNVVDDEDDLGEDRGEIDSNYELFDAL